MESKLDSVEETDEVAEVEVYRTIDDQPVKDRKSKKHDKDRNKAGRVSMALPNLDPLSNRAPHDISEGAPQSIPRRNKLCTATYPGENQHPSIRSNDQYRDDGAYDGTYDGTYDNSYEDSWHREPRRWFTPYYEGRHLEEHAPPPLRSSTIEPAQ
jgi:hypothetical protein